MKRTRILVIDDNRILREGLAAIIKAQPDMRVVAAIGGGINTLAVAKKLNPEIILIDLSLRNQNGMQMVKSLCRELHQMKVIGMGLILTQLDIVEFVAAGASGFITKDASRRDFLKTIRSVSNGMEFIPPSLTGSLFSLVTDRALQEGVKGTMSAVRMTKREREIVALIAEGLSNKQIGARLSIKIYTVKSHVHNILEKLALHSRLQISVYTRNEERHRDG